MVVSAPACMVVSAPACEMVSASARMVVPGPAHVVVSAPARMAVPTPARVVVLEPLFAPASVDNHSEPARDQRRAVYRAGAGAGRSVRRTGDQSGDPTVGAGGVAAEVRPR